jgi:two-component system response regulator PilR (NtrC family)
MRLGAYDFLAKPTRLDVLEQAVRRAAEKAELLAENRRLRRAAAASGDAPRFLGTSEAVSSILRLVGRIGPTDSSVLIQGENGTGKELIARELHHQSRRAAAPLVVVNCGAIPGDLVESELFGHEKGAFTGADRRRVGLFEAADSGTLFLDEVGELPLAVQPVLLRALQFGEIRPVGSTRTRTVDVRLLSATNQDLAVAVREGRFREDLFYRLNVIEIQLPPLRERIEDLPQLIHHFLEKFSVELGKDVRELEPEVLPALEAYAFPGNVRELENIIERAVTLARTPTVTLECLPATVRRPAESGPQSRIPEGGTDLDALLAVYETSLIEEALQRSGGVKKRAAQLLGVTFRSLRYRLEKLHLDDGEP